MFDFLRRMIVPIMTIALIGFLATIIFQWGMDISSRDQYVSANTAAVINGEEVTWREFNAVYDRLYQAETSDMEEDISEFRRKELRTAAWQQILHDRLVMQQVRDYDITVTDEELYAFLRSSPPMDIQQMEYFQTNGVFDYQKYRNTMADPQAAGFWAQLEPIVRNEIVKQKLQEMVILTAQVTEAELKSAYLDAGEKVKVGMVNVSFDKITDAPEATDEQLRTYYEAHSDNYQVEARAVLNLVAIEKLPGQYDWEIDSVDAVAIHDSLVAGADFDEMAQIYSQDITAQSGGDLGWFEQGQMVAEFDNTVFSMKPGEISAPVKTEFGWHIIKLHEFRDGDNNIQEAHASHILFKVLPSGETMDRIHRRLRDFRAEAAEYGFAETAAKFELEMLTTSPFAEGDVIDHLGVDTDASRFAFETEEIEINAISPVFENRSSVFVVQLAEQLPAGLAGFDEVKEQVGYDYEAAQVKVLCQDKAQAVYAETQQGTDLKQAALKHEFEYTTSDEFTRNTFIRDLGVAAEPVGAAFALKESGDISEPVDYARGTVILQLLSRSTVDESGFTMARDSLYQTVLMQKKQQLYGLWFDHLVEQSDIVNNIETSLGGSDY